MRPKQLCNPTCSKDVHVHTWNGEVIVVCEHPSLVIHATRTDPLDVGTETTVISYYCGRCQQVIRP